MSPAGLCPAFHSAIVEIGPNRMAVSMRFRQLLASLAVLALFAGCSHAEPGGPPVSALANGRIDIRTATGGRAEFYNIRTGQRFNPYGFNYIVLGNTYPQAHAYSGFHNLFDTAGDNGWSANRTRVRADLAGLAAAGYNIVRVFFNGYVTGQGGPDARVCASQPAIDPAYFDNFIDFLRIAREHRLHVTCVVDRFPNPYLPADSEWATATTQAVNEARRSLPHKMTPFVDLAYIRAQQRFTQDAVRHLLASGLRDVLFSIEPIQEVGFRTRYPTEDKRIAFVPPWGRKAFGPWPANPADTAIRPSVYNLADGSEDAFRFYVAVSYYFPEQIVQAVRAVPGAEDLLVTFSTSALLNGNRQTVGFDERAWHHWMYAPSLARLAQKDKHAYVDIHLYPVGLPVPTTQDATEIRRQVDGSLHSFGLLDGYHGPDKVTRHWRRETLSVPLIFGEVGARRPDHPATPRAGDPGLATPEAGIAALKEFVRCSSQRGAAGCLFWLHSSERTFPRTGRPSCFYTAAEFPLFNQQLAPVNWRVPYFEP